MGYRCTAVQRNRNYACIDVVTFLNLQVAGRLLRAVLGRVGVGLSPESRPHVINRGEAHHLPSCRRRARLQRLRHRYCPNARGWRICRVSLIVITRFFVHVLNRYNLYLGMFDVTHVLSNLGYCEIS